MKNKLNDIYWLKELIKMIREDKHGKINYSNRSTNYTCNDNDYTRNMRY